MTLTTLVLVYENGVFRPLDPVELPEGAQVEVSIIGQTKEKQTAEEHEETSAPLMGEELAALLQRIDALPLEGDIDSDLSTTYREVLYPKCGDMP
jgi:predicted DNA-binding antitoxin AbrB/MazE fold protein